MGKPLTILIINFYSPQNAGDLALLEATIHQLNKFFNSPKIIISTIDPSHPVYSSMNVSAIPSVDYLVNSPNSSFIAIKLLKLFFTLLWSVCIYFGIKPKHLQMQWQNLFDVFEDSNLVISCPGNHFFTKGKFNWPIIMASLSIILAICFHKPLYVMPQSLVPLKRWWEKLLLHYLFNNARYIFVREKISLNQCLKVGLNPQKLLYIPDLAFAYPEDIDDSKSPLRLVLNQNPENLKVGLTVIPGMIRSLDKNIMDHYYSILAQALAYIIEKYHAMIYFFPQVVGPTPREDDRIAIQNVVCLMEKYQKNIFIIEEVLPPKALKQAYGHMDIFIASRLHSGIFSVCQLIPTIFIGYLSKTKGVVDCLGYSDWFIPIETISDIVLKTKIEQLVARKEEITKYLHDILPGVISKTYLAGQLVAEDYDKLCE